MAHAAQSALATRSGIRRQRHRRRLLTRVVAGIASVGVVAGVLVGWVAAFGAPDFVVNSAVWGGPDASPGDGVCATSTTAPWAGECTLRAALEELNAVERAPGDVTITVDDSIAIGTRATQAASGYDIDRSDNRMDTSTLFSTLDTGAWYEITQPVTIDLEGRLILNGSTYTSGSTYDGMESAMIAIAASDVTILNAHNVLSPGASFVVAPHVSNVTIDGSTVEGEKGVNEALQNYSPERFVVFREGVSNITVRDYTVSGYYNDESDGGIFVFDSRDNNELMSNIVVDNVDPMYATGSTCNGTDGSGCRTRLTNFWSDGSRHAYGYRYVNIDGLTFRNMHVTNMTGQFGFQFGYPADTDGNDSVHLSNLLIEDNVFENIDSNASLWYYAFITLPYGDNMNAVEGSTAVIRNNVITTTSTDDAAIAYYGRQNEPTNSTRQTDVYIYDNHFDGFDEETVRLERAGNVTVEGNTFGSATESQTSNSGVAEEYSDANVMFNTEHSSPRYSSNHAWRTWYPSTTAEVLTSTAPEGALQVEGGRIDASAGVCTASTVAAYPTATDNYSQLPPEPVTLQVYWTAGNDAEVYLGEVTGVTGKSATLLVPLPMAEVQVPIGQTAQIVDPVTGAVGGRIRFQTHIEAAGQLESTQYSRWVGLEGVCAPTLTVQQEDGQAETSMARDRVFVITSSMGLDVSTFTTDDLSLAGSTAANARVVSFEEVEGSDGTQWRVVVHADDTGSIQLAVPADAVTATTGLTNGPSVTGSTEATNNVLQYVNPLQVTPQQFPLILGDSRGRPYEVSTKTGAPVPVADIWTTVEPDAVADQYGVEPDKTNVSIPVGDDSVTITVTAPDGTVTAGTKSTLNHAKVTSSDPNYDGLILGSTHPALYATDPILQIEKRAYTGVDGENTLANIEAGDQVATGAALTDREPVWFVFTVTNISKDDWETSVTDIDVTDDVLGTIGHIDELGIGESVTLVYGGNPWAIVPNGPVPPEAG